MKRTVLLSVAVVLGATLHVAAAEPVKYAVLVGVKEYEHPKFTTLKFAENDVSALGEKLRGGGFRVTQLSDSAGARDENFKPTRANIVRELDRVLKLCTKRDMVIVALSGHGLQPFGSKENFFCPADARVQDLKTLIGMAELYEKLDTSAAQTKLILADCCRDDPAAGKGITKVPLPPEGVGVLLSCSPGEQAYENTKLQHGIFYYFLLDGLSGKAKNDEGNITFGQLAEYVQRRVSRTVPTLVGEGAKQSPNLVVNISGESPLLLKGSAIKTSIIDDLPKPVNRDNSTAKDAGSGTPVVAPPADGKPTAREILGNWAKMNGMMHFRNDGVVILTLGPVYLNGIFTCAGGVLDINFPDINWDTRMNVAWANAEKTQLYGQVVATNMPSVQVGYRFTWQRTNQAEPTAPPTRKELVGNWSGEGVVYSMNADHTFVVRYDGGQMRGQYGYNGNVLVVTYTDMGWASLGLMAWADRAKTTVRSTMLATTVPNGSAPGTRTDFVRVK